MSDLAKKKEESDKRIQEALEARKKRKETEDNSLASKKKASDSRIEAALAERSKRVQSTLPSVMSDIENLLTVEIDHYNGTKPSYGTYDTTYESQRERRTGISNLRSKVSAYRNYMNTDVADKILSMLDQMEKGYDSYLSMSGYESEDAYKQAAEKAKQYYDIWGHYADEDDFQHYSDQGAAIKNPTLNDAESGGRFLWWEWEGDEIGNIVTYSRENALELASAYSNRQDTIGDYKYRSMTEEEVGIYNYLLAKEGKDKANEFLAFLDEDLNAREGGALADRITGIDIPVVEQVATGLFGLGAGLDQWASGTKQFFTNEQLPTTVTQYANSEIANSLDGFGSYAYQGTNVIGNMLPSILLSYVTAGVGAPAAVAQGVGAATVGISAAGNAYGSALAQGYNVAQSRTYGTLVGIAEGALQYLLGGIGSLGGITDDLIKAKINIIDNSLLRIAAKLGVDISSEILEEEVQNYLEPALRSIILGEEYDAPTIDEIIETAIVTAITTPFLGGGDTVATDLHENRTGKAVIASNGGVDTLMNLAYDVAGASSKGTKKSIMKQADMVSKKATANRVGALYGAVTSASTSANQADITKSLKRNGFTSQKANAIAEALIARYNGQEITRSQSKLLESVKDNQDVQDAIYGIIDNSKSTMGQRIQTISSLQKDVSIGRLANATGISVDEVRRIADNMTATAEDISESHYEVSTDGKTIDADGNIVSIKGISSIENGRMTLMTEDGNTIDAGSVSYSTQDEALVYEAVSRLEGIIDIDTANKLSKHLLKLGNAKSSVYISGIVQAYTYGYYGYGREAMTGTDTIAGTLTEEQRNVAYGRGEKYRDFKTAADQANARSATVSQKQNTTENATAPDGTKYQKVRFESDIKKWGKKQKAEVAYIDFIASNFSGNTVHVFESYKTKGGKYVYEDSNGNIHVAPNGMYIDSTGDIYLDLNAGNHGEGLVMNTFAHELYHHIQRRSPEKARKLAEFLVQELGYKSVEQAVQRQIDKAERAGHGVDYFMESGMSRSAAERTVYDRAFNDFVADSLETMFTEGDAVGKLQKLRSQDEGLFNMIKNFIDKWVKKLRKFYSNHSTISIEGDMVRQLEKFEQIQQMFVEALVDAGENYQAALENVVEANAEAVSSDEIITDGAVVTDGVGTKYSIKSMKHDIAEGQMFEDLKTYCGWTQQQVNELRQDLENLVEYMTPNRGILDMNEAYGMEGRRFSPYKRNSDPLYKISMDFSTLCSKRLLTQYVIENLQLRENRPMSAEEQMAIRDMLNEYRKVEKGLQVACAMCYVEAARLKSPKQMQKWLDDPAPLLRDYFGKKNKEFNDSVKKAQADFKESRGYARNATKKDMKPADVKALNKIGPKLRSKYQLSAEEQAIVDKAKTLPNSTYLTAGNLSDLSETYPVIYDAYTSFVRSATRSKSLETDEPYYYGDSRRDNGNGIVVSDSFIETVNRENGMRFSSWSDWRIQHLLDYITAVIDNSVRGAAMHGYTKFGEEVRVLGKTGMMFNMSGVAGTQTGLNEDGSLNFSPTESIDVNEAVQLRDEFPETAGLQCIGVSNAHIIALLRSDIIDYVIPYHVSGLNAALRRMADIYGWDDYTGTQHAAIDKSIKKENAADPEHWHEEPVFSEFFVGYYTGMSGIEAMRASAERYKQMCKDRGLTPKFNQFANEDNYWKLLIDRKMINQKTGDLIRQKAVTPTFDFNTIKGVVDRYVDNYDSGLEARALNHIVENWDSIPKRIKDLKKQGGTKAKKTKKAVGTLANQTLAAQPTTNQDTKLSVREEFYKEFDAWDKKNENVTFTTGTTSDVLKSIGMKDQDIVLRSGTVLQKLKDHPEMTLDIFRNIPDLLEHPVIVQFSDAIDPKTKRPKYESSITVLGELYADVQEDGKIVKKPVLVSLELLPTNQKKTAVLDFAIIKSAYSKNALQQYINENSILYIDPDKKRTDSWLSLNRLQLPLGENRYGPIRKIAYVDGKVKVQNPKNMTDMQKKLYEAGIIDEFGNKLFSDRDNAPTFYSQMAKVVDGVKQEKLGAASVVSMLRGKGVKAEEIKWSGIEAWLEGKKSVTKAELQEFIAGSMLQIGEQTSSGTSAARWSKYKLDGGENYREIVFTLPNSSYSNQMMRLHWGEDAEGVLAHARTQDMNTFIGRMLFIEEIQSDWHNEGHAKGYESAEYKEAERVADELFNEYQKMRRPFNKYVRSSEFNTDPEDVRKKKFDWLRSKMETAEKKWKEAERYVESLLEKGSGNVPDAPFRDTYHEYVMKRLLRMAAEEGYDSIGWTPAQIQVERWSEKFAEGYRIEYDQDIPKFLNKYGKKWGTKVGKTVLDNGTEVWSMAITDSMKESVLTEGQPLYSDRDSDGNQLSQGQQVFFKDSKIRDANGNLLKVFHGTPKKFTTFRQGTAEGWGQGIYFTDNIEAAKEFGENIVEAYLNITNPFNVDTMNYNDIDFESTKAYRNFDKKYWQRWYDEYDTYEEYRDDGMGVDIDMIYTEYVDVFNQILRELGYDGIVANQSNNIDGYEIVAFHENQPKLTSNTNPTTSDDLRFQDRSDDSVSNRSLLANAFEGIAKPAEMQKLQEYKDKIDLINAEEKKLRELNAEIKELSFAKGPKDTKRLKALRFDANQAANRINTYDKQLLRLEASQPLQDVLAREKKRAYAKAAQRGREALAEYKAKVEAQQKETAEKWRESRKKAVEQRKSSYVLGKIKAFKARLESSLLSPTDRRYVPIDLIKAMVEVCDLIDTDTDLYKADGSINKAQEKRNLTKERLQNLKDEYEKLKNHSDPIYAGEFDEMVYAYLTELRDKFSGKSLKEMSLDELTEMYEILRGIEETLQDARKLIGWGDAENVYEAGDAIVSEQNQITESRRKGKRNAVQKARDASLNLSLSPVRNVERMSGYHEDSFLLKLFKKFEQGIRKKNRFVMEAYKSFDALTSGKEYDDAIYQEVGGKRYEDVNGRKFGISKMQMMQTILSYEREVANGMHHIENSGFSFADLDMLRKGRLRDAISEEHSHRVPAAVNLVAEFSETLKDDKWCQDYMAAARKFFNGTAKDAINETSIALKHRIIAKDKSYIPFEVDKNFVVREISAENDIQQTINSYGMLKETKKGASQPLIITGLNNILDRHIDQVGNVYGLAIEVRNFNKVWNVRSLDAVGNDPTVKAAIQRNWGNEGVKHIEQAVQDIQGPRHNEQSVLYKKVKSGYIGATFLLNLSVVTKQVGSLFSATSMLRWRDPGSQIINLFWTMANHKKISAEVDKYTATAWMRRQGLSDAELHTFMTEGKKTLVGKLVGKLPAVFNPGKWITAMDHAVALSLWRYSKIDTAKRTGLKGEELLKATAEFYDDVIENTQSMTDVLHRPEIQKRSDVISEAFAMFKTDLYQMAGQLHVTTGRFVANKTKANGAALGRTLYAVAASAVWAQLMTTAFALLRYKVKQYRDDEDEELTYESWLKRQGFSFAGDLVGYILPIFGSEIVGFFENIMYGESDEIVDSIALTAINDLYDMMITVGSSVKDKEMPDPADIKKLTVKALQIFGIPASNILRTVEAIQLHAKDIANGEFFSFEAGVDRSPKHHIHRIMEAVEAGKTTVAIGLFEEAVEETAEGLTDEELDEAKATLKTALGNKYKDGEVSKATTEKILSKLFEMDEDEIYWTFDKWGYAIENGSSDDYAKYGEFYDAVQTGKNLKAVIKKYTDNGVKQDTLSSQISSHFKPIYIEMSTSEKASIKGYLLNAWTVLGVERKDAEETIKEWEFESKYGFAYSDKAKEYKNGNISAAQLKPILISFGGMTAEEANYQIEAYDWEKQGYEDVTMAAVRDYNEHCATSRVPKDVYLHIRSFANKTKNDVDANGKAIAFSAMKKVMAEINRQSGLTSAQKTAIARSLGWADKNIQKYKTW